MNLADATAVYIGDQAASAVYITDAAGTATQVWPTSAPSPYPVSGTYTAPDSDAYVVVASHTITEAGTFTVTSEITEDNSMLGAGLVLRRNGDDLDENAGPVSWTGPLDAGDLIEVACVSFGGTAEGTWSVALD